MDLWNKDQEISFFTEARKFAAPEQLFYIAPDGHYYAYWPKTYGGTKTTLQSRNSLIGKFTEAWSAYLLEEFAESIGCYTVQGAVCDEIGLPRNSSADLALCKSSNVVQKPEDIKLIFEIKMSVVWNWELEIKNREDKIIYLGDYQTHQGNPGLLRSDTMLKAIGKSINIRVSSPKSKRIPIIILGNTPITKSYYEKVDHLRKNGIIQGFWSINPNPLDENKESIKSTPGLGFQRIDNYDQLLARLKEVFELIKEGAEFFSGMKTARALGAIIEAANRESTYERKAQRFLELIKE